MIRMGDTTRTRIRVGLLLGIVGLVLGGCENGGGGTAPAGIGTGVGAAAGVGAGRLLFGNSTTAMIIGGAAGGLAGNMALDRPAEVRGQQEREAAQDAAMQRQLDFERQRALQAAETEREIEERRLFEQWQRERYGPQG